MIFQPQLRIPGPTPLPERVTRAMSAPMIDHRGPEFASLLAEVTEGARKVFGTQGDVLVLTASGTGGLESAIANLVSPGDKVVAAICGNFGERFADLAAAYGAEVVRYEVEWGEPTDPDDLRRVLASHPDASLVLLTHNETSTGLTNQLEALVRVVKDAGRLAVVDGVSSVSSMAVEVDRLGVDVCVSGSQKGWMAPPGIALVTVSTAAWKRQAQARSPRFYFDYAAAREFAAKGATPFTPAVGVLFALREGIRMLLEEGLDQVYRRHREIADATEAGLEAAGFRLYAADGYRSATVTSALPPDGLDVNAFRKLLREKYGVVVAGGQGKMTGKMIRVGHLGAVNAGDIVQVLWAIEQALEELDIRPNEGRGVAAAAQVLGEASAAPALT
ncbi:MAG TPA: alanine--glyoxylate aminotransferase family protein [Candidatus Dormibacteraeota bacterium]